LLFCSAKLTSQLVLPRVLLWQVSICFTTPDSTGILALVLSFALGGVIGAVIGFFVARIGVPSFVVTLGLFLGFQGLQLVMLGEGGIFRVDVPQIKSIMNDNLPDWAGWAFLALMLVLSAAVSLWDRVRRAKHDLANRPIGLLFAKLAAFAALGGAAVALLNQNRSPGAIPISGVPIVVPISVLILFVGTLVLDRTRFGRHLYAVGGNPEAARRAGIKVANIRIAAFIICSLLAVLSGLFHVSRIGNVEAWRRKTNCSERCGSCGCWWREPLWWSRSHRARSSRCLGYCHD
jgi:D-xylose transport system permease protein